MPSPRRSLEWLLALLVLACAGRVGAEPPAGRAEGLRQEALALAAADDGGSLARATELLEGALRVDPRLYRASADRTLVELLVAAERRDEAALLASAEGDELMQSGRDLRERALDELRPLVRDHAADPAVVRALAIYYGLDGNAAQTAKLVALARAAKAADAWIDFAELAADLRNGSREAALPRLSAFTASHPGLLRPRMMLARALLDLSRGDDALAALEEVLAANPRHDAAQRLKARILSPPPVRVAAVPAPEDAPPPRPGGYLPRKRSSNGGGAARTRPAPALAGTDSGEQ